MSKFAESKELAKALRCDTSSSETIHECMKKQDFETIMDKLGRQPTFHASPRLTRFNPRVDNDFFPYKLEDMVRKAPKKKTLNFVTDMESAIFVVLPIVPLYVPKEKWTSYTSEDLLDYIRLVELFGHNSIVDENDRLKWSKEKTLKETFASFSYPHIFRDNVVTHEEFARRTSPFFIELRDFYLYRDNQDTSAFYLTRLAELVSDLQFNVPIVHEVELKRLHGWDTYFAVIDYESETTRDKDVPIRGMIVRFLSENRGGKFITNVAAWNKKTIISQCLSLIKFLIPHRFRMRNSFSWSNYCNFIPIFISKCLRTLSFTQNIFFNEKY